MGLDEDLNDSVMKFTLLTFSCFNVDEAGSNLIGYGCFFNPLKRCTIFYIQSRRLPTLVNKIEDTRLIDVD